MSYVLDITTDMLRMKNFTTWVIAENLHAGKYTLTGSGQYSYDGKKWYAYNDGLYAIYAKTMWIGSGKTFLPVVRLFGGKQSVEIDIAEGGRLDAFSSEYNFTPSDNISDGLRYELFAPGEGVILPPLVNTPTPGPVLNDCVFPTLQWNLIQVLSDLIEWIGCILHNIITILQWVVDWFLHFSDHLDEWVSRLFGIDPALPFWDELEKKLRAMIVNAISEVVSLLLPPPEFWKDHKIRK